MNSSSLDFSSSLSAGLAQILEASSSCFLTAAASAFRFFSSFSASVSESSELELVDELELKLNIVTLQVKTGLTNEKNIRLPASFAKESGGLISGPNLLGNLCVTAIAPYVKILMLVQQFQGTSYSQLSDIVLALDDKKKVLY